MQTFPGTLPLALFKEYTFYIERSKENAVWDKTDESGAGRILESTEESYPAKI